MGYAAVFRYMGRNVFETGKKIPVLSYLLCPFYTLAEGIRLSLKNIRWARKIYPERRPGGAGKVKPPKRPGKKYQEQLQTA